jgi:GNAT superfamily N-acetyltransferase
VSAYELRPLTAGDAEAGVDLITTAFAAASRAAGEEPRPPDEARRARSIARIRRFAATDAPGCWAADDGEGGLAGLSVAIRREDLWGLALLFVHPDHQSAGLGRRLLARTRPYADGARTELIMASGDSRAIRSYASLGLRLHPAMMAKGTVDRARLPSGRVVRPGSASDLDLVDDVDRRLRRVPRTADIADLLAHTDVAFLVADRTGARGFALHINGSGVLLGADDEATARDLLWEAFAHADGEVEHHGWTVAQHWALQVALAAGLAVTPSGPFFARGLDPLPGPWLPSGVYF